MILQVHPERLVSLSEESLYCVGISVLCGNLGVVRECRHTLIRIQSSSFCCEICL